MMRKCLPPVLVWYIGECMVSIIDSINIIKKLACGYKNCNITQILILGDYVKAREYLNTQVIIWVNTILFHIDTRMILLRYEDSCMVYIL